jgi:hypothetical protein
MGLLVDGAWQEDISRTKDGHFVRRDELPQFRHRRRQPRSDRRRRLSRRSGPLSPLRLARLPVGASHPDLPQAQEARRRDLGVRHRAALRQNRLGIRHPSGGTLDTVNGKSTLAESICWPIRIIPAAPVGAGAVGQEARTIVNNESSEIIRMLNSAFDAFTDVRTDYYPAELRGEIDRINDIVYPNVNNGVYRAGFATTRTLTKKPRGHFRHARSARRASVAAALSGRAGRSPKRTGGCSPRSFASTRSITATSNAICGASSTIRISGTICAIFIRCPASPRPSASITSSGTITAASATSIRPASCRSGR